MLEIGPVVLSIITGSPQVVSGTNGCVSITGGPGVLGPTDRVWKVSYFLLSVFFSGIRRVWGPLRSVY